MSSVYFNQIVKYNINCRPLMYLYVKEESVTLYFVLIYNVNFA
jgi:hypothetical protein